MHVLTQSLICYGASTLAYGLLANIILVKFHFDYPLVIAIAQSAICLFTIEAARSIGVLKLEAYTFTRGRNVLPLSVLHCLATLQLTSTLDGMRRPMFNTIQALAPLVAGATQRLLDAAVEGGYASATLSKGRYYEPMGPGIWNWATALVVACTASGAAAVYLGLELSLWSHIHSAFIMLANVAGALLIERHQRTHPYYCHPPHHHHYHDEEDARVGERAAGRCGVSAATLDVIYLNAFNSLCLYLVADILQDELRDAYLYTISNMTPLIAFGIVALVTVAVFAHFATFVAIEHAGPMCVFVARNFVGTTQVAVMYQLSIFLFYDIYPNWVNSVGVATNVAATVVFFVIFAHRFAETNKFQLLAQN